MTAVLREFLEAVESGKPGQWGYKIAPALRALLDEVEGLRVDRARLDWLESQPDFMLNNFPTDDKIMVGLSIGEDWNCKDTVREAIDTARQPDPSTSAGRA